MLLTLNDKQNQIHKIKTFAVIIVMLNVNFLIFLFVGLYSSSRLDRQDLDTLKVVRSCEETKRKTKKATNDRNSWRIGGSLRQKTKF